MRILIYGAGVIGTLYGVLFSKAGFDTYIYARGKRLRAFQEKGVLFCNRESVVEKISQIKIIDELKDDDIFDFIFLCVRENQLHTALKELRKNRSPYIVTMVNSLEEDSIWEEICAKKIIRAFPGAGGSIKEDVLHARLTSYFIQPTTFSDSNVAQTRQLIMIFKKSEIPYQVVEDMHAWQICHLAMVVPLADAYYANNCFKTLKPDMMDKDVWRCKEIMKSTAIRLKKNFRELKNKGHKILPKKLNLFLWIPTSFLSILLSLLYRSEFANTFMFQHSINAMEEMFALHNNFYGFLEQNKV